MEISKDLLQFTLKLKVDGEDKEIFGGNIADVQFHLHTYGFDAAIQFWWSDDKAPFIFCNESIIEASLSFSPNRADPKAKDVPPIELKGIVTERALLDEHANAKVPQSPIWMRLYSVRFKDNAQVIWSQHYPTVLYVEKTLQEMLDLQKNKFIDIQYDWEPLLSKKRPIIALGLGCEGNRASFYDFFMWYLDLEGGIWEYDYSKNSYSLKEKKKEDGAPVPLQWTPDTKIICHFPEPIRSLRHVLNGYAEDPKTQPLENANAFENIRRDDLLCSSIPADQEEQMKIAKAKSINTVHYLVATFGNLPPLLPGELISFESNHWEENLYYKKNIYRLRNLSVHAHASNLNFSEINHAKEQGYNLSLRAILEIKDELTIERPLYIPPKYPFHVEGKIFSEAGEKEQMTVEVKKDEETSLEYYEVEIPLWENQKIIAPFEPQYLPAQMYFPACKGERVCVGLEFLTAKIEGVMDWWPRAKLPSDKQGDQIIFTPKDDNTCTYLNHTFESEKTTFTIERLCNKQVQTFQLKEECALLEIKADGETEPKCSILLDNATGITILYQDKDKNIVQKIIINDESIKSTSKGDDGESSYTQKPDLISIECKKFEVKAEEEVSLTADTVNINGTTAIKIMSTADLILQGAQVNLVGDAMIEMAAPIVNINGDMTTVAGSLIKVN